MRLPCRVPKPGNCAGLPRVAGGWEPADLPGARGAAGGRVGGGPAAQPVAVEVGGGVVDGEALLVALAHFGEDVDPGLGLHAVIGLDVQRPLRLDDLEHLGRWRVGYGAAQLGPGVGT